eukprot:gene12664-16357_t
MDDGGTGPAGAGGERDPTTSSTCGGSAAATGAAS